jgi:hypothetical protein
MGFKPRGYIRDTPKELVRDYKLFAIACEGDEREPAYFRVFQYLSKSIKVDVIQDVQSDPDAPIKPHKSAPNWVLDRAVRYVETEGLTDEDDLWFVIDTDHWQFEELKKLADYCADKPNWHLVISNPCFEVWLYFHKRAIISDSKSIKCKDFKNEIADFEKGGYHPYKFLPDLQTAIQNAKAVDTTPLHFMPADKSTKVYQLGEAILRQVPLRDWENFIQNEIPKLIQKHVENLKIKRKTK